MSDDKLQWALELASRGIRILPVHWTGPNGACSCGKPIEGPDRCRTPGKHPIQYRWEAAATTDADTIRKWFKETPSMNYGLMAGADFLFVDIDTKDADGWQSVADLLGVNRDEVQDSTFCVVSPSGGGHLYFKAAREYGNTSRTALGTGVDTRSGNGQVLGPGSGNYLPFKDEFGDTFYQKKFYSVANDAKLEAVPSQIESRLTKAKEKADNAGDSVLPELIDHPAAIKRVRDLLKIRKPAIQGDGGDNHTFVTILVCRDHNLSPETALELLTENGGWNDRCDPPWDIPELESKIQNAYSYAKEPQGNKGGMLLEVAEERGAKTGDSDIDGDSIMPQPGKPKPDLLSIFDPWTEYAAPVFPLESLPDKILSFAVAKAEESGVDVSAMVMACLGALSGAIPHNIRVELKPQWYQSPVMWILLVGDPSSKKSPAIDFATGPLARLSSRQMMDHARLMAQLKSQDASPDTMAQAESRRPPQLVIDSITTEALSQVLTRQARGILSIQDELSGWLGSMGQYKGTSKGAMSDRAHWLKAKDGGPRLFQTIGRGDNIVKRWSVSLLGGVQPEAMAKLMADMGTDGLLQRFCPVMMRKANRDVDVEPAFVEAAHKAWEETLLAMIAEDDLLKGKDVAIQMADGAHREFRRFSDWLHDEQSNPIREAHFRSFLGKQATTWGALALILHMVTADDPRSKEVSEETAKAASRIVESFVIPHGLAFYEVSGTGESERLQAVGAFIVDWLESGRGNIRIRDLQRGPLQRMPEASREARRMADLFTGFAWLDAKEDRLGCSEFVINPALKRFKAHADRHKEAHAKMVQSIRAAAKERDKRESPETLH